MKVNLAIPPLDDVYPHKIVRRGLEALGHEVGQGLDADILVTWSPWNGSHRKGLQNHFGSTRRPVVVMENGWLSPIMGKPFYQVALDGWNGMGRYPAGDPARWYSFGLAFGPWKPPGHGGYSLVIGQRGHHSDARTAVPGWEMHVQIDRPEAEIVRRGRNSITPLGGQIAGAREVHVWTSNVGCEALLMGVPVVQHGPNHMLAALTSRPGEQPNYGSRAPHFERAAWAQWDEAEISSGLPFLRALAYFDGGKAPA